MTVHDLLYQLEFCLQSKHLKPDDELVLLGSGDKTCHLFLGGLTLPPVAIDHDKLLRQIELDKQTGFYSIGIVTRGP